MISGIDQGRELCFVVEKDLSLAFPPSTSLTQFPVAAERDHVTMLASVTQCESEIPASINQELSLLLHEVSIHAIFFDSEAIHLFIEVVFPTHPLFLIGIEMSDYPFPNWYCRFHS